MHVLCLCLETIVVDFAPSPPVEDPERGTNIDAVQPPSFAVHPSGDNTSPIGPPAPPPLPPAPETPSVSQEGPKDGFVPLVDFPDVPNENDLNRGPPGPPSSGPAFIPDQNEEDYDIYDVFSNPTDFIGKIEDFT